MNSSTTAIIPEQARRIVLEGEWDLSRKDELKRILDAVPADEPLAIDLQKVTFADSSFLSALAMLRRRFQEVPITLLGPQTGLKRILTMMQFDRIFRILEQG
jgi:anti-anti-sigma factor